MPKLGHPNITKGQAISYLVQLYRNDPEFIEELDMMRRPNLSFLYDLVINVQEFGRLGKETLSPEDYRTIMSSFVQQKQYEIDIPFELRPQFEKLEVCIKKLEQYLINLDKLAFKWKLRIPSVVSVLLSYDMFDFYFAMGMPSEMDIPLESLANIYPWAPPIQDLVIRIPAWSFFLGGREQITRDISAKLLDYENKLKSSGYHEHPSSLQTYARWWFLHYVKEKTYDQIAGMETNIPGGRPTVYPRNIGIAVRQFSKLIGISSPKDLK